MFVCNPLFTTDKKPCDSCVEGYNMFAGDCISDASHTTTVVSITLGVIAVVAIIGGLVAFFLIRDKKKGGMVSGKNQSGAVMPKVSRDMSGAEHLDHI